MQAGDLIQKDLQIGWVIETEGYGVGKALIRWKHGGQSIEETRLLEFVERIEMSHEAGELDN